MELNELLTLLEALASAFRVEADEPLFHAYRIGIEDLPPEAIRHGIQAAMRECQFMPTVFELRKLCGIESPEARALKAWERVKASINGWQSVDFDCPVINATIRVMGGWIGLCDTPAGEAFDKWARKDFEKIYCELWRSGVTAEMARPLLGLIDTDNGGNNRRMTVPKRIETGLKIEQKLIAGPAPKRTELAVSKLAASLKGIE